MTWLKHALDRIMLLILVLFVVWLCVPTSLFIKPVSWSIEGDQVRFVRETPFGTVTARWRSEITLVDGDGLECSSGPWRENDYQVQEGNTITYKIGTWADDCIDAGPPFYVRTTRQVLFWGLPLRSSTKLSEVQGVRAPNIIILRPRSDDQ